MQPPPIPRAQLPPQDRLRVAGARRAQVNRVGHAPPAAEQRRFRHVRRRRQRQLVEVSPRAVRHWLLCVQSWSLALPSLQVWVPQPEEREGPRWPHERRHGHRDGAAGATWRVFCPGCVFGFSVSNRRPSPSQSKTFTTKPIACTRLLPPSYPARRAGVALARFL